MAQIIQKATGWLHTKLRALTPGYNTTGGGRATQGWDPGNEAINCLIRGGGDQLRRQSRDLIRRNAWAAAAIDAWVTQVIGTGITPLPKHPDPEVRDLLQRLWLRWTDEADASGLNDFYGLQALACRATAEAGECIARLRPRRPEDGLTVPLQIQLLEPEHLPLTKNEDLSGGRRIRWGIEFDAIGRRQAYHLYREHPGETPLFYGPAEIARVPSEQVLHLFDSLRPGQYRGQPRLTPVMLVLHELEKYDRAELIRKGLASMFAFFEHDIDGQIAQIFGDGTLDGDGKTPLQGVEPGSYIQVPRGKTVEANKPPDSDTAYPDYLRVQLRKIAAALGISYEQLTGDMTSVNFSSARVRLIDVRRGMEMYQHQRMAYQFCRPVWREWIRAAALAGKIDARDFARQPDAYYDVEWQPPTWPWVDPLKEGQAEVLLVDNLLKSRTRAIKQTGLDREDVDREIEAEQQSERDRGLKRNGNGAKPQDMNQRDPQEQEQMT